MRKHLMRYCWRYAVLLMLAVAMNGHASIALEFPAIVKMQVNAAEQQRAFRGPLTAKKSWRICVVLPNVSDDYWDQVIRGVKAEAMHLGVDAVIYEASGYSDSGLRQQQRILEQRCSQDAMDAVLVAAINDGGLNKSLALLRKKNMLIVDFINGYDPAQVDAHAMVDFFHLGRVSGESIAQHLSLMPKVKPEETFNILWVPGPDKAAWAKRGDQGFKSALKNTTGVNIETLFLEPHYRVQSKAIREHLLAGNRYDLIVGTAPTTFAAVVLKNEKLIPANTPLFAYYNTSESQLLLGEDQLINAVTDDPELQGRVGIALVVGMLQKEPMPYQVGPVPKLLLSEEQMRKKVESLSRAEAAQDSAIH